ncbi:MAG: hypothetical protein V1899_02505 [Planctomycetota bacterium]
MNTMWTIPVGILSVLVFAASSVVLAEEEMWKPKAEATSFVPDWTNADKTDGEATDFFLKNIWPEVKKAAESLDAKISNKKEAVYLYSGKMSEDEKSAGVVCFSLAPETVLPWYAVPSETQVSARKLSNFAARGQSEPFCVGVHALRDVKNVEVKCGDLKGPAIIPASAVTCRLSLSYTIDPRGRGTTIHARQMLLLKVNGWDIPKNRTYEWVLDVHVPVDAQAGLYKGAAIVTVEGKKAAEFELGLEVLPFTLTDNGCRWGAFMSPNPGHASDAWCDLNSRYGFNTFAWWNLDDPKLNWTWDGIVREELVLAKIRDDNYDGGAWGGPGEKKPENPEQSKVFRQLVATFPDWLKKRQDGPFFVFKPNEVINLPKKIEEREPFYKKQLILNPDLGELTEVQAKSIRYDRPGWMANFDEKSIETVQFEQGDVFRKFDEGMKRIKKYGFMGPITWFGSGGPTAAWETRVISMRFGSKYDRVGWKWEPKVTSENTNHVWYMANAAVAKTFSEAPEKFGWPEVVWVPCDEVFQYKGVSGRSVANMIAEMMPYIRHYAPKMRIYMVVWHKKRVDEWQCGTFQKIKTLDNGLPSPQYGPYHVICTNNPNDEDRQVVWDVGGEYWTYSLIYSVEPIFGGARFAMGFKGVRHFSALSYSYADQFGVQNLTPKTKILKSAWIAATGRTNYYLSKNPEVANSIDYAIASHAMLAIRQGVTDRKYAETLRVLAYKKNSAEDIAYIKELGTQAEAVGISSKGGEQDFTDTVKDEGAAQKLRCEIANRIKALVNK